MAKQKMRCVFSEQLCRECPMFRGRHYYLCFSRTYRGYLGAESVCGELSDRHHVLFTSTEIQHHATVLAEKRGKVLGPSGANNHVEGDDPQQG